MVFLAGGIIPSQLYAETPIQALQETIGRFQGISHEAGQVRIADQRRSGDIKGGLSKRRDARFNCEDGGQNSP
jgi:hypothetical protein